jgi:hypothetical protein
MSLLKLRGIEVETNSGSKVFYPAGGPVPGDTVIIYPLKAGDYIVLSIDTNAGLEPGDTVAVDRTKDGFFIFSPLYPVDPVPQGNNIVLLQELTAGYPTHTGIGHGTKQGIGHYSVYWDGLGDLYVSGAPDALTAFTVNDCLGFGKCYGNLEFPAENGVSEGPLLVTDDEAGGQRFFKKDWVNNFKCYLVNYQGSSLGCGPIYLLNVRPV